MEINSTLIPQSSPVKSPKVSLKARVLSLSYEVSVFPGMQTSVEGFLGDLRGILRPFPPERRGKLKRTMMRRFATTQNRPDHTVLDEVRGLECSRSQERRVHMSSSMAFIWKCVPRIAHTWKS